MSYSTKKLKEVAQVDWGNTSLTKRSFVVDGEYLGVSAAGCDGRIEHFEYEPGTLVISAIGANCRRVFYPREKFTAIKNTIVVTPKGDSLDSDYLFFALEGNQIRRRGGAQPFISKGDTENYEIPLPPMAEQRRIAAKIEKQFAKIDEAARLRAESLSATDQLLPAALHEVFSKGKQKGWGEKELGSLCDILDNKRKPVTRRDRKSGPYPYYGATQVQDYVADYIFDEPLVLLGEDGARWGANESSAYEIEGKTWVNNHAHVLRPHRNELLDSWLVYNLNYADLSGYITGTTVKKLNQEKMRSIKVPLPPLVEQKEIVKKLDALSEKVRALRELQLAQAADLKALKQSILHEAFAV